VATLQNEGEAFVWGFGSPAQAEAIQRLARGLAHASQGTDDKQD